MKQTLCKEHKEILNQLREAASINNVNVIHLFNKDNPLGGLTIAYKKVSEFTSGNMVQISVATCSKSDNYCRKTGTFIALSRFFLNNVIQLPLASPEVDLKKAVTDFFIPALN